MASESAARLAAPTINLSGNGLLWWNVFTPSGSAGARYVSALALLLLLAGGMFVQATFQEEPAA